MYVFTVLELIATINRSRVGIQCCIFALTLLLFIWAKKARKDMRGDVTLTKSIRFIGETLDVTLTKSVRFIGEPQM